MYNKVGTSYSTWYMYVIMTQDTHVLLTGPFLQASMRAELAWTSARMGLEHSRSGVATIKWGE